MATVLIPLAQGCEELEAVTLMDILRRAGVQVTTASLGEKTIKASRGAVLLADMTLDEALEQEFDMIVLPGGMPGSDHLKNDPRIITRLQHMAAQNKPIAAICAAPMALHHAGLLEGRRATSFPGVLEALPGSHIVLDDPVVVDGNVITSRGPGTAMDFALRLVEILLGKTVRDNVEKPLQRP